MQVQHFSGSTFDPVLDGPRLTTQFQRVFAIMQDGDWHTLSDLAEASGGSEAGVSARLRDMRKERFGGHVVQRQRGASGLWFYRLRTEKAAS
jgi:hypothetical protein